MKIERQMKIIQVTFILSIILFVVYLCSTPEDNKFHSDEPVGSDSYMEDSLAYAHPSWSYERIQQELYGRK